MVKQESERERFRKYRAHRAILELIDSEIKRASKAVLKVIESDLKKKNGDTQ